ncbi:MAG: DUF5011 domain-containing protein [Spirochaetia bacterium]|nr:DUF5011 domain-containing protein [Spirochaetia bacterium]
MKKLLMILFLPIFVLSCEKNQNIGLPVITLIGPLEVFFDVNAAYVEFGYKATDASGRDITDSVICDLSALNMSRTGSYRISYTAVDRLGKKSAAVYRTVHVGIGLSPVITIAGENPVLLALNSEFTPPSATAVSSDGNTDLSESVSVDAENVDTSKPGTYSVYYTVSDTGGVTATEVLTVYVLESAVPRIVVDGAGTSAENPLVIEQLAFDEGVGDEEKLSAAAVAFKKALPVIKAYDLEDGDISYRVSVTENEAYTAALQAILDGTESLPDPVKMTVSDKDGNVSSVDLYVSVIPDNTPPVITIADEQAVYEIEIDMWSDQWSTAWEAGILNQLSVSVSDDGGVTPELFPKEGTSEGTAVATASGIKCWIEYPDVINSSTQESYPDSNLKKSLEYSGGENTNCYYYQTPNHEINTKTVLLKAKDTAGNAAEKSIKVFLKDTTPPEILTSEVTVDYGTTIYSWDVRDNSGYKGTRSNNIPDYNGYQMRLVEGTFTVPFSDTDYNKNSVRAEGKLTVKAPPTGNVFSYGQFTGSDVKGANEQDMIGFTPENWNLTSFTGGSFSNMGANYFCGSKGQLQSITETYSGFLMCGGARKNGVRAYLTCGYRNVDGWNKSPVSNVNLGIRSAVQTATLFESVTYALSYKYKDFFVHGGTYRPGSRVLTIEKQSGTGTLNDGTTFKIERSPSTPANTEFPYNAITAAFTDDSQNFTVKSGNINSFTILYSVGKADNAQVNGDPDVGSFISNIQVKAVNWNKLQPDGSVAPANGS